MRRHGHTGFLLATHGIDGGTTEAVRASLLCAPSGPPANAPGPPLGIANGRDAGTCRGGAPLGGLLCALWPKRGSAWLIVFSGQFLNPTLVRCTQRFEQSLGGCLRVAALQGLVAIRLLDPLARQAARSMTALNPVGGSLRAER